MEFIVLLVFVLIVSTILSAGKARATRRPIEPGQAPGQSPPGSITDLLAEFRRAMEQAAANQRGPFEDEEELVAPPPPPRPIGRFEASSESEAQSLEVEVRRPERILVDHDAEIDEVTRRRARLAQRRDGALTDADHRAFDQRIRQPEPKPAAPPAQRGRGARLRQLMIWREILEPPVALRDRRPDR